ncbi:MAG TPA: hypothetical protein VH352_04240, partial [Pseudonocardiaceae bacterium]|nr:hypothetical protein [Pseudonocardiaceae bacterium]
MLSPTPDRTERGLAADGGGQRAARCVDVGAEFGACSRAGGEPVQHLDRIRLVKNPQLWRARPRAGPSTSHVVP